MRYLTLNEVLTLYRGVMEDTGGLAGIRDLNMLESALAQPHQAFGDVEFYPSLVEKAAALGFSLIQNHPFVDGNKRLGHAAIELFLILNGWEIEATADEQEQVILNVAASRMDCKAFTEWLNAHVVTRRMQQNNLGFDKEKEGQI
jgi:death-on-curing protein